jgi:hypothetical protein
VANSYQRKAIVFICFTGILTLTTMFLLALSPDPLKPDSQTVLWNTEPVESDELGVVFQTDRPIQPGYWSGILIHHSKTPAGNGVSPADPHLGEKDHFVIGNGQGALDGEIQISSRWRLQTGALPPPGTQGIDRRCISICLVGDFDQTEPTDLQMDRLSLLVRTLRTRLGIPAERVWMLSDRTTTDRIQARFPRSRGESAFIR